MLKLALRLRINRMRASFIVVSITASLPILLVEISLLDNIFTIDTIHGECIVLTSYDLW